MNALQAAPDPGGSGEISHAAAGPSFREQVEAFERNLIKQAMQASGGNQSETACRLQITR